MPALLARMGMGAFLRDACGPSQFGIDRAVHFRERTDDFLRGIFSDDLGRVGLAIGILENESRSCRCCGLAFVRRRNKTTAGTDERRTRTKGIGSGPIPHDLARIIVSCATWFMKK